MSNHALSNPQLQSVYYEPFQSSTAISKGIVNKVSFLVFSPKIPGLPRTIPQKSSTFSIKNCLFQWCIFQTSETLTNIASVGGNHVCHM